MKTGQILLVIAAAVVIAAFGSFIAYSGGSGGIEVAEIYDDEDRIGDFVFITEDGQSIDIAVGTSLDDHVMIAYSGDIGKWNADPEVNRDSNLVVFSTYLDGDPVDYVFVFGNIESDSLEACLDDGRPTVYLTPEKGFIIELYYCDAKGQEEIQEYSFYTCDHVNKRNVTLPVYYGDNLFKVPSTQQNGDMMAFALCLELSTGPADGGDRSQSVMRLMRDIGYVNATVNDAYKQVTTIYSTDVAIGSKEWNGYNIILLALNGTNYTNEFAANVMLGAQGDHQGFALARDEALKTLRTFISENNITGKTKILLTGYSRTAAGANLTAAYISDAIAEGKVKERIGDIELAKEDVYGYSFETPLCGIVGGNHVSPTDPRYDNIWYIVNCDDPVTYVPSDSYGFVRFGHQFDLQSHDEEHRTKMLELVEKYYGQSNVKYYDMSRFTPVASIKDPQVLWDGFIDKFFEAVGSREYYHKNIEDDFVQFVYIVFANEGWLTDLMGGPSDIISFIVGLGTYADDETAFKEHFEPLVKAATSKNGCEEYTDCIVETLYQLTGVLKRYADGSLYNLIFDQYALAMVANYNVIFYSHLPTMVYCYVIQESELYS